MLILVCALTHALAIGGCVGALMVRGRAGKMAVVRRNAMSEHAESGPRQLSDAGGSAPLVDLDSASAVFEERTEAWPVDPDCGRPTRIRSSISTVSSSKTPLYPD